MEKEGTESTEREYIDSRERERRQREQKERENKRGDLLKGGQVLLKEQKNTKHLYMSSRAKTKERESRERERELRE